MCVFVFCLKMESVVRVRVGELNCCAIMRLKVHFVQHDSSDSLPNLAIFPAGQNETAILYCLCPLSDIQTGRPSFLTAMDRGEMNSCHLTMAILLLKVAPGSSPIGSQSITDLSGNCD